MSSRREYLLEAAYQYVLEHGLNDLSLRPLARAIGSSPRVLLFVFESKENLVRTLLARARQDELDVLERVRAAAEEGAAPVEVIALAIWEWLSDAKHRGLLGLWVEVYARSLIEPAGALGDFGRQSVKDWLPLLDSAEPESSPRATAILAILRGGMLDLLATDDLARVDASVKYAIHAVAQTP